MNIHVDRLFSKIISKYYKEKTNKFVSNLYFKYFKIHQSLTVGKQRHVQQSSFKEKQKYSNIRTFQYHLNFNSSFYFRKLVYSKKYFLYILFSISHAKPLSSFITQNGLRQSHFLLFPRPFVLFTEYINISHVSRRHLICYAFKDKYFIKKNLFHTSLVVKTMNLKDALVHQPCSYLLIQRSDSCNCFYQMTSFVNCHCKYFCTNFKAQVGFRYSTNNTWLIYHKC